MDPQTPLNINWGTVLTSIIGSSALSAFITHVTELRTIKESGLYTKRAKVLDELMERFERLDRLMGNLVSFLQNDGTAEAEKKRRLKAIQAFESFYGFYRNKRHYLTSNLANEIEMLCNEYRNLFSDFTLEANPEGGTPNPRKWNEIYKKYRKDFDPRREKIAQEFRKMIGVK